MGVCCRSMLSRVKQFVRWLLYPIFDSRVHIIRRGMAKGLKRRGGLNDLFPGPMSMEDKFLSSLDLSGRIVYDIGAYRGITTIFFARGVGPDGRVISFEPNPHSNRRLREAVSLNGFSNVQVMDMAVGKEQSRTTMAFKRTEMARASVELDRKEVLLRSKGAEAIEVEVDALDSIIKQHSLPRPDFVKIDVEGLDEQVLEGMTSTMEDHKPNLFLELHGHGATDRLERLRRIMTLLGSFGYCARNVETGTAITSEPTAQQAEGHIYCT